MFDVSFGEMMVIGLLALLVLGPERLPKAARLVGLWIRRARGHWFAVRAELENELAAEELRRSLRATQEELRAAHMQLQQGGHALREGLDVNAPASAANASTPAEDSGAIAPLTFDPDATEDPVPGTRDDSAVLPERSAESMATRAPDADPQRSATPTDIIRQNASEATDAPSSEGSGSGPLNGARSAAQDATPPATSSAHHPLPSDDR